MVKEPAPIISVVIPTYNRANKIRCCLDSVLNQTFSPYEVIVADDCSTDETVKIIKGIPDARIRCIVLDRNSGAQAARNRGIHEAKGDWIAFQDSDDEWLPDKLEKQVIALAETGFDPWTVVHGSAIWLDTVAGKQLQVELPLVEGNNAYLLLLSQPAPMFPAMLVSRIALEKINWLDEKVPSYQEWDTAIRLAEHCRFVFLKDPLFVYNLHGDETISKNKLREITGYHYVIDKFRDEIKKVCGEQIWETHLFIQWMKCLDLKLWEEADNYFHRIEPKRIKYRIYQLFRYCHFSPRPVFRILGLCKNKTSLNSDRKGLARR